MKIQHGLYMNRYRAFCRGSHHAGVPAALRLPFINRPACRQVAVYRVVGRCLISYRIRSDTLPDHLRKQFGRVAQQTDGHCFTLADGIVQHGQCGNKVCRFLIDITRTQPEVDPALLAFDHTNRGAGHGCRKRLGATHTAQTGAQDPLSLEIAVIVLPPHLYEGFIGALNDSLAGNINP